MTEITKDNYQDIFWERLNEKVKDADFKVGVRWCERVFENASGGVGYTEKSSLKSGDKLYAHKVYAKYVDSFEESVDFGVDLVWGLIQVASSLKPEGEETSSKNIMLLIRAPLTVEIDIYRPDFDYEGWGFMDRKKEDLTNVWIYLSVADYEVMSHREFEELGV